MKKYYTLNRCIFASNICRVYSTLVLYIVINNIKTINIIIDSFPENI